MSYQPTQGQYQGGAPSGPPPQQGGHPQYPQQPSYGQPAQQQVGHQQQAGYPQAGQSQQTGHPQQQAQYPPQQSQTAQFSQPSHGSGAFHASDAGNFNGGSYQISHRDTNSILTVTLQNGGTVKSRPGAMIEMAGTIVLQGKTKFSMKKMLTGGSMNESVYSGSGALTLAPVSLGDIATIQIDGSSAWKVGKDAFLAATPDVHKEAKAQGLGKALFSGEDLFVYNISGQGLLWVSSFGAITRREIAQGQTHIVDNGHLVAWNCQYTMEKAGGGLFTSMKTGEGAVCRFTGPGVVFIQTRNFEDFSMAVCKEAGVATSG